ncbi:Uncharacterised protein [Mycobacterium tuberculosis]|uniref:Uncharacterized protein n=1 Tax=Mycobacterium tuberculosis TaxID=1773 RepID=A0A655FEA4_MYCTX|nr:Uncharacterised protein [Mycobacterium tuberculosis]COW77900.1 Uncharacterised protein [Mycobacterium tuberculosis]COX81637.1 Uncharacterised protein [Mycobacterium tuberculosis]
MATTAGVTVADSTDATAVRSATSAIAEDSTSIRWRADSTEREGRPSAPASAPGTSGMGTGGPIASAVNVPDISDINVDGNRQCG